MKPSYRLGCRAILKIRFILSKISRPAHGCAGLFVGLFLAKDPSRVLPTKDIGEIEHGISAPRFKECRRIDLVVSAHCAPAAGEGIDIDVAVKRITAKV